jgi:hypothetical protein
MLRKTIGLLLLGVSPVVFAQTTTGHSVPRLVGADLPRYPPIAEAAHVTGWIRIRLSIESGKVIRTEVVSAETRARGTDAVSAAGSPFLVNPTLETLKSWRFAPDVADSLVVTFTYGFAGSETDQPTNPSVEILPSLDVNITARPIKPVVMY